MAAGAVNKTLNIYIRVHDAGTRQLTMSQRALRMFGVTARNTSGQLGMLNRRFLQVGRALLSFLIIRTVSIQLGNFFRLLVRGNTILERATTSLRRLGGSLGFAKKQIDFIRQTAMRAPFDFESILSASRLLVAYGQDLNKYLPILLDWAAALGVSAGELEGYAAAMGKIMAGSPYVMRILTTRGVGLDAWKAALQSVNKELPKSQQYAQALEIVLGRFEGQASVLAKTMAGLKTNIHDVWVEMTREIGLSMFVRIRSALFDVYGQMRDVVDNQKETLYEIGDIIGLWTARLIKVVRRLAEIRASGKVLRRIFMGIVALVTGNLIKGLVLAIGKFAALSLAAKGTSLAVSGVATAAGLIALAFVRAKLKAIDLNIYLGDVASGLEVMRDFAESEEKIFTREELGVLRAFENGIDNTIGSLSELSGAVRKLQQEELSEERWKNIWGALAGGAGEWLAQLPQKLGVTTGTLAFKSADEMVASLQSFVDRGAPLMEELYGDKAWGPRVQAHVNALKAMHDTELAFEIAPDADEYVNLMHAIQAELTALVPLAHEMKATSEANQAAAEGQVNAYMSLETLLNNVDRLLKEHALNAAGIAGYEQATTENVRNAINFYMKINDDLEYRMKLLNHLNTLAASEKRLTKEQVELGKSQVDNALRIWGVVKQRVDHEREMGRITQQEQVAAYQQLVSVMEDFLSKVRASKEDVQRVVDLLRELGFEIDTMNQKFDVTGGVFNYLYNGIQSIVGAFGSMEDAAKDMHKAIGRVFKALLVEALKLLARLALMAILMQVLNLKSGNMTGWAGAVNAFFGGGVTKAQHGYKGWVNEPTLFMAGEHGQPEFVNVSPKGHSSGSGGNVVNLYGDVYDGEAFMRKVEEANYTLSLRRGGEA